MIELINFVPSYAVLSDHMIDVGLINDHVYPKIYNESNKAYVY